MKFNLVCRQTFSCFPASHFSSRVDYEWVRPSCVCSQKRVCLKVALYSINSIYTWRRMKNKNELFVSTLDLSSWHSQWRLATHPGFFVHISILLTVAMATDNCKDNNFLLFSTYLLSFLEIASVKYLETRHSRENDFRQYLNLIKRKIYLEDS